MTLRHVRNIVFSSLLTSSFMLSAVHANEKTPAGGFSAPMPIFPIKAWQDYIKNTNYTEMPEYLGFTPQIDSATGQVKTSTLSKTEYGTSIPVVIRCNRPEGCKNYKIIVNGSDFTQEYANTAPFLLWTYPSENKDKAIGVINYISIPPDSVGNKGTALVDIRKNYNYINTDSNPKHWFKYYGEGKKEGYSLSTPYQGVIAILYLSTDLLSNPRVNMMYGNMRPEKTWYSFPYGLVKETPYIVNGFVWKYIDSGFASPQTSWTRTESLQTGTQDSTTVNLGLEVGVKVGYGGAVSPWSGELSTTMSASWGTTWSSSESKTSTTEMSCNNLSPDAVNPLACGIYQLYASTLLQVPGISDSGIFDAFNKSSYGSNFALYLGTKEAAAQTDDKHELLGVLYPVAGTLAPRESLNVAQPSIKIPYTQFQSRFVVQ